MAPHPHSVELDMDRKEELIIAKQLRACRVNILPRNVDNCYQISSLSPSPSPRTSEYPNLQQQPSKDSCPIAMRYWNQCQSVRDPENDNSGKQVTKQDAVDEPAMQMQKLTQQKQKVEKESKVVALPTMPDIRNKIKENTIPSSQQIFFTNTEKINDFKFDLENHKVDKNMDTFKVLSTAGSGINRENDKFEALANLNIFITVDKLPKPQEFHGVESKPISYLPPKLPFLNEIHLLKRPEPKSPSKQQDQVQTIPDLPVKKKINAHIGHIENRPTFGDLPFLNDIKSIGVSKPEVTENLKQIKDNIADTQHITGNCSKTLPTVKESAYVREEIQSDILKYNEEIKMKSPSPKINRFFAKDVTQNTMKLPMSPSKHQDQVQTIPDLPVKKKINAHIGHIENRPTFGDLPFLNYIKSIGVSKPEVTENLKQIKDNIADTQHITGNCSRTLPTVKESAYVREEIQSDILKYNEEIKMKSPSPKMNRFSGKDVTQNTSNRNSIADPCDKAANEKDGHVNNLSDLKSAKPTKTKKATKYNIKIDEKSNMSKLSDQIIPQLNTMQKNYLGLLFFNELSQNIVEDIVVQQLSMMPGTKLASVINSLEQQVCDTAVPLMLNCVSDDLRTSLVCETFGELNTQDKAGVLFTTGDDVMEVCTSITEFGGRAFKKALIKNMIGNEDKELMNDIVQEHLKDQHRSSTRKNGAAVAEYPAYRDDSKHFSSAEDENYNSAEESLADVGDEYEYFDFENK